MLALLTVGVFMTVAIGLGGLFELMGRKRR